MDDSFWSNVRYHATQEPPARAILLPQQCSAEGTNDQMEQEPSNDAENPSRLALRRMVEHEPDRHPLVFGLVAPLGTRLDLVTDQLRDSLRQFGYDMREITLSKLLDEIQNDPWGGGLPTRGEPEYYQRRMAAGDTTRKKTGSDAILAAMASGQIASLRRAEGALNTTVYVLSSLKHPDEAELLKHVYGSAFWLLAVVSDPDERREDFAERLAASGATFADQRIEADELISRDEDDESASNGQHVASVFKKADYYLPIRRGYECKDDVERFLDGVFGKPFMTPFSMEEAMRLSYAASLRSAAAGRQVGATLIPRDGSVYVTGTNEVPKPGGGQFWAGDQPDHRDFQSGYDPNPLWSSLMLEELFGRLSKSDWLRPDLRGKPGSRLLVEAREPRPDGTSLIGGTRADAITEFTRCLHAEQAAIVNAAMQGISTRAAVLVTTTFPCHECAKFIVGAGIHAVVYIEPYPKSMVRQLYRDLIDAKAPMPSSADIQDLARDEPTKVPFLPFVGFAPHRYDTVFRAGARKQGVRVVDFEKATACPRGDGWAEPAVIFHEGQLGAVTLRLLDEAFGPVKAAEIDAEPAASTPSAGRPSNKRGRTAAKPTEANPSLLDDPQLSSDDAANGA